MKRYLVTTALQETWSRERPLLMLGEWCRPFALRSAWSGLDIEVAAPVGRTAADRRAREAEVRRIADVLLGEIGAAIDSVHGERHDARYWRIVMGHWLIRFVSVIHNRLSGLAEAIASQAIGGTALMHAPELSLASRDSLGFILNTNDDLWNHVLYGRILGILGRFEALFPIDQLDAAPAVRVVEAPKPGMAARVRSAAVRSAIGALNRLARDRDAVLVSTYLPTWQRIRLELALGQVPQVWRLDTPEHPAPDAATRAELAVPRASEPTVEHVARELWPQIAPSSLLEGRRGLLAAADAAPLPSRPRFVFTANSFDTDELFKVWAAGKAEQGVPYLTAQHGNNYATHVWAGGEFWPERAAADVFVTWGWSAADPPALPAFMFSTAGDRPRKRSPAGRLLLIEVSVPHRITAHDPDPDFAIYQEEQFRFAERLPPALRGELLVRLHAESRRLGCGEAERWAERAPSIPLDHGDQPGKQIVAESRLVVHSYDSTGILQCLALDIPMLCFWHGGFDHVLPGAQPYYRMLEGAGIFHDTPEGAADAAAKHWGDVDRWWQSRAVQQARRTFCDVFARSVPQPTRVLKDVLERATASTTPTRTFHDRTFDESHAQS